MVEKVFSETIIEYGLLKKKDKLLLGISGGPDSIALLHLFCAIKNEFKLKFIAAHFNHGLRKESDQEEKFVKNLCKDLGVKCITAKREVAKVFDGDSLEQTARNLRFDFFLKCARQTKYKKIALAHHKDDLIETVLMRFIRGSGMRGLRGFLPKTKYKSLTVIRPLIDIQKQDILSCLKKYNYSYCIDKSNFQDKFLRNKIRMKLLPKLKEINPNIVEGLSSFSKTMSLDYDFIYNVAYNEFCRLKRGERKNKVLLDLAGLKKLHRAVFYHVIRVAIEELKGNIRRIETRHLDEIYDLAIKRPSGSIVDLPYIRVQKQDKSLDIQTLIL
jgi:tRNA(Ile)-lysidine synthase